MNVPAATLIGVPSSDSWTGISVRGAYGVDRKFNLLFSTLGVRFRPVAVCRRLVVGDACTAPLLSTDAGLAGCIYLAGVALYF